MAEIEPIVILLAGGAALGVVFGIVAERSQFCLLSGVRDAALGTRSGKLAAFAVALLTAAAATQSLALVGWLDLKSSIYFPSSWSLIAVTLGGAMFGLGAALTRGCSGRLTILAATGNLRAVLVLIVFAVVAYATQRGVLAWPRMALERAAPVGGAVPVYEFGGGRTARVALAASAALAALAMIALARSFRARALAGLAIGLVVAGGWALTGVLAVDPFTETRAMSVAFTGPIAAALQYLMTATGAKPDFGVMFIAGVLAGAALSAAVGGTATLQGFESAAQTARYMTGAVLMGFGGVVALGCSTGQGLSGASTLSLLSFVALASIVAGMLAGVLILDRRAGDAAAAR